ncbi:DUF4142 domain-containing protein [Ralstonia chuxiongensis]|uniref:DUF4142 domain-containing protein n=1 Tax=Ralstonia chuxiongensis TaxID=2957504 RepID=UPI0028F5CBA8|nr:DUF4142 domain-containing protein [Ralstonia chuxiongensis]CAJ0780114.1 hypothetical protein R8510_04702 [Ralstonia chuxiongensis]
MPRLHIIIVGAALLLGASTTVYAQASTPSTEAQSAKADGALSGRDLEFLEDAAQSGLTEIEASRLAQQTSTNSDVNAFAAQMIKDHIRMREELARLAASKGYTPAAEPSLLQQVELKALAALNGEWFDKAYSDRIGVAAHESTVRMFKEASKSAQDPDIKAFAANHLPALEQHLEMARDLENKVRNE